MPQTLVFIIGCTGSGKGSLARCLARRTGADIASIDSMKIYRRMDIGTAKPTAQDRHDLVHHLIDIVEPSVEFSVAEYVKHAEQVIERNAGEGRRLIFVGGTALYIKALTEGLFEGPSAQPELRRRLHDLADQDGNIELHRRLNIVDPAAAQRIHVNDRRRLVRALEVYEITGRPITALQEQWDRERTRHDCRFIGLRRDSEDQNRRTNARVKRMIDRGLVDEVRNLLDEPLPMSETAAKAVGYAEIIRHLRGELSLADAVELIKINTRQLAKSQRTWFKRFRQTDWIDVAPDDDAEGVTERLLQRKSLPWSH